MLEKPIYMARISYSISQRGLYSMQCHLSFCPGSSLPPHNMTSWWQQGPESWTSDILLAKVMSSGISTKLSDRIKPSHPSTSCVVCSYHLTSCWISIHLVVKWDKTIRNLPENSICQNTWEVLGLKHWLARVYPMACWLLCIKEHSEGSGVSNSLCTKVSPNISTSLIPHLLCSTQNRGPEGRIPLPQGD